LKQERFGVINIETRKLIWFMELSTIFYLYRGGQFYWWSKPEYKEKITDKLFHINVASSTPLLSGI
jgi:hypothetical protein